jgi:hypothetical protein
MVLLRDAVPLDDSCNLPLDSPFTAAVARAEGVSRHRLGEWCAQGLLRQPLRRVYVVAQLPDTTRLRAECLALVVPEDCVICDRHAGWLHGAEMVLAPGEHLDVLPISVFRPSGHGRLRNDLSLSGERNLRPSDVTEVMGIPVTTPVRTAWDLGRVRRPEVALSAVDQLLRLPGFPVEEFLCGVERFRGMRWVTTLRVIAPLADARAESPPESALRWYWLVAGLPCPQPQLEIWRNDLFIARVDLANEELGYVAEYYGEEWHGPEEAAHDEGRVEAVERAGFEVDVFRKENVYGQRRDVETLLVAGARRAQAASPTRFYL